MESPIVVGRVAGNTECAMTVDSGALMTMVRADLVREEDFTGEVVTLKSVCGKTFTTRAARVWLHFKTRAARVVKVYILSKLIWRVWLETQSGSE